MLKDSDSLFWTSTGLILGTHWPHRPQENIVTIAKQRARIATLEREIEELQRGAPCQGVAPVPMEEELPVAGDSRQQQHAGASDQPLRQQQQQQQGEGGDGVWM